MKDLHNHILYNIDDGSMNYQDSIKLLKDLENRGVTEIVVTPHYIIGTKYNSNNEQKRALINKLQSKTKIKLYIGNEVFLDNGIIDHIKNDEISTINNSKYLLIEFPLNEKMTYASNIIFELRKNDIIPIIAHPERYHYLSLLDFENLINEGCLLQGNITSLTNKYGKKAKHNLKLLLQKHMIHVLGTDTHQKVDDQLNEAIMLLEKIVGTRMSSDLLEHNFTKIINNNKIEQYPVVKLKGVKKWEKIK